MFALNKKNNILIIFYILIICYKSRCKGPVVIDRRGEGGGGVCWEPSGTVNNCFMRKRALLSYDDAGSLASTREAWELLTRRCTLKLQLQNGACKPAAISVQFIAAV